MSITKIPTFEEIKTGLGNSTREQFGNDFNVSSVSVWDMLIGTPVSLLTEQFYQRIVYMEDKMSIYKATSFDLDRLLGDFLFSRKQPTFASGFWVTRNSTPGTIIPIGDLTVEKSDGTSYKNTLEVTIDGTGFGSVPIQCETQGVIGNAIVGEIDRIKTPVAGIISGENEENLEDGQDLETDTEYRVRFLTTRGSDSYWNTDGIWTEITKQPGVLSAVVKENDLNVTGPDGLLPHSRVYVVEGGNNQDIAEAIFRKTDRAIQENGNDVYLVKDLQGNDREVRFERPTNTNVEFELTIIGTASLPDILQATEDYINDISVGGLITETQAWEYVKLQAETQGIQSYQLGVKKTADPTFEKTLQLLYYEKAVAVAV